MCDFFLLLFSRTFEFWSTYKRPYERVGVRVLALSVRLLAVDVHI